jgi:hypothetical protein
MTITRPFLWKFDRSRYSNDYLVRQVSEDQVQTGIIDHLAFYRVDAVAIDAGMKRARGRMIAAAYTRGVDVREIVKFKNGGIPAGWSDLTATLAPNGVSLYIEVKAPAWINPENYSQIIREAGRPTEDQLDFLDSKQSRGAIVMVAWSVADVLQLIGDRLEKNRSALS